MGYIAKSELPFSLAMELPITFNWKKEVVMYIPQVGVYYYFK